MLTLSHHVATFFALYSQLYIARRYGARYDESFEQARGRAMKARSNYLDRLNM